MKTQYTSEGHTMKVIFITREGFNLPGARLRCYYFARELEKYGVQTQILSFSDTLGAKDGQRESEMGVGEKVRYNIEAFGRLVGQKGSILFLNRCHYHIFAPYLVHILKGNKLVLDLDDWEMREDLGYYLGIYPSSKAEFLIRRVARHSSICFAASMYLERFLSNYADRVCYLPSGIDTNLFKPIENEKNDSKIRFCWIGTLHRSDDVENVKFIMDCFSTLKKRYHNVALELVGDGTYIGDIRKAVSEVRDDNCITVKGWIHPEKVPEYLSTIDIGLMPLIQNTRFNRAKSPTKLLEYMAMGKPTISSDIGEANNIIEDGKNGLLFRNKEEFIDKMRSLIVDEKLRESLGQRAIATIRERYSLSIVGKKLYEILKSI